MTAWEDEGAEVERAAFGPRLRHAVRAFEVRYRGPCGHAERVQLALVGDLRSACQDCAAESDALRAWGSTGPCSSCGALLGEPAPRTWVHESASTSVLLHLRLCTKCSASELIAIPETDPTREDQP